MRTRTFTALSILLLLAASVLQAQAPADNQLKIGQDQTRGFQPDVSTRGIVVDPLPPNYRPGRIDVDVWTDQSRYWIGEDVRVYFRVDRNSYIYIFSTDPSGITRQIFPNRFDPDNRVRAGVTYRLPDSSYRLVADGPPGRDTIYAVATTQRYGWVHSGYGIPSRGGDAFPIREQAPEALFNNLQKQAETDAQQLVREEAELKAQARSNAQLRIEVSPRPPWHAPAFGRDWHTITITGDGWWREPYDRDGYYREGRDRYHYESRHYDDPAELELKTWPTSARVYVNGHYEGRTPLKLELAPGDYNIMIEKPGYDRWERHVRLEDGADESYRIRLQR
ncbi:DUF4384 domain-containing protein [bacterium]|nr:DUF4384 domain-containing protein [bacterium]